MSREELNAYKLESYYRNKKNKLDVVITDIELLDVIKNYIAGKEAK